jgi:hypothetical protein
MWCVRCTTEFTHAVPRCAAPPLPQSSAVEEIGLAVSDSGPSDAASDEALTAELEALCAAHATAAAVSTPSKASPVAAAATNSASTHGAGFGVVGGAKAKAPGSARALQPLLS